MKTEDKIRKKVEVGSFVISNIWRIMEGWRKKIPQQERISNREHKGKDI